MFDLATANWFSGEALPSTLVGPWNGIVELGYTMGLVGCVAALTRRVVFTPEKLKGKSQLEGNFILFLIMTITTTSFIVESGESPSSTWEPLGYWFAEQGVTEGQVIAAYWAHMLAICTFFVLIPMSKHILGYGFYVFFYDTGQWPRCGRESMIVAVSLETWPLRRLECELRTILMEAAD